MVLREIFSRRRKEEELGNIEEYIEVEEEDFNEKKMPIELKIEKLEDFNDTPKIQSQIRMGNIIVLKIKDLKTKDLEELQRCIDKLKKTVFAVGGDIIGIDENIILITPVDVELTK